MGFEITMLKCLEYFFGSRSKIDRFVKQINEDLSEYEKGGEERPESLRDAYTYFLTSVACALCLKKDKKPEKENMTMMVHPSGLTGTHEKYINWLKGLQDDLRRALKNKDTDEHALKSGYISIVPVKHDLTDHDSIKRINDWDL